MYGNGTSPTPQNAAELHALIATMMRLFISNKDQVHRYKNWLAVTDLKAAPFNLDTTTENATKAAVQGLDTVLGTINLAQVEGAAGLF